MNRSNEISIWGVVGVPDEALLLRTFRVLRYCNSLTFWRSAMLFTVTPLPPTIAARWLKIIQIPHIEDRVQWQILIGTIIPRILKDYPWTLRLDEDGFIIDPKLWHPDFMQYDYVAAPWAHNGFVGSGGVALTSDKFNRSLAALPWYDGALNADEFACRVHRQKLLEAGVRFAPPEVAACFCTETTDNEKPSFCFHGRHHSPDKYAQGWRQIEQWEKESGWLK